MFGSFGDPAQATASRWVATRADLNEVTGPKLVGLFSSGNLTMEAAKAALPAGATPDTEAPPRAVSRLGRGQLRQMVPEHLHAQALRRPGPGGRQRLATSGAPPGPVDSLKERRSVS